MGALAIDDKKLRSDFRPELERVLRAIRDCERLDAMLHEQLEAITVPSREHPGRRTISLSVRGAAGIYVRLTEQIISNRTQRAGLIKELHSIKKDVLDRDLRIAKVKVEAETADRETGATAALLALLQQQTVGLNSAQLLMEPSEFDRDVNDLIRLRLGSPEPTTIEGSAEEQALWPEGLPQEVREGDIVSDPTGVLWIVLGDGAEPANAQAEELFLDPPGGAPPHARLEDGRLVLVYEIDAPTA